MTTLHPLEFIGDEIEVADALIVLKTSATSSDRFPRWGHTKRRSNTKDDKAGVRRLSPSTPLSFSPSGGDETPPPHPVPPRPPAAGGKIYRNMEQHKEWVKEQNQMIATLSAAKATLQQFVLETKSRYQRLSETNSWLKEMQSKMRETIMRRQLYEMRRRGGELDLFPVGPARAAAAHRRQCLSRQQVDLNRRTAEEEAAAAERQRQACAQARKRRIELQRVKSSLKIQRLR